MQVREKHVAIVLTVLIFLWTSILWLTEFDARWLGMRGFARACGALLVPYAGDRNGRDVRLSKAFSIPLP